MAIQAAIIRPALKGDPCCLLSFLPGLTSHSWPRTRAIGRCSAYARVRRLQIECKTQIECEIGGGERNRSASFFSVPSVKTSPPCFFLEGKRPPFLRDKGYLWTTRFVAMIAMRSTLSPFQGSDLGRLVGDPHRWTVACRSFLKQGS